ncbi:MAG: hypothetical protein ABEK84_01785 [Salinibacter sp.]
MIRFRLPLLALLLVGVLPWTGCTSGTDGGEGAVAPTDTIAPQTRADSVAYRLLQAHGADAWASAPYLRFDFGVETPDGTQTIARHLWNRKTGEYRIEWSDGPDSSYVALVNVRKIRKGRLAGTVYLNGEALTGAADSSARKTAYARFVNDTYWLLSPLKVFDPGVNRTYLPDSSTAEHDVIKLTFDDVGRTPGDKYWLYVSKTTGRLDRWAYHLQSMPEKAPPQYYDWTQYRALKAPAGTVHLAERKESMSADQAILTNNLSLPSTPPDGAFSNPEPMLGGGE